MAVSDFQKFRRLYNPRLPSLLTKKDNHVGLQQEPESNSLDNQNSLKTIFSHSYGQPPVRLVELVLVDDQSYTPKELTVGVVLSGGQAPGGHNVIAALFDALQQANTASRLLGFLNGPKGIIDNKAIELNGEYIANYRNCGGFDMIGSGRTKIETEQQFARCVEVANERRLDALVIIGGDDSNTNAALMAEYFIANGVGVQVIGIPKTIDGDLRGGGIEVSFGFDTAAKTYAELVGNIARDAASAKKYWHFIKLMGRSASHICLEIALQCQPNIALISEETWQKKRNLNDIVESIVETVIKRAENGDNYGIVLVPEGLIEFIPEMRDLIAELNDLLAKNANHFATLRTFEHQAQWINSHLSRNTSYVFSSLPSDIQRQLLIDRDPHGNVQVSRIETEKLLIEMVESRLQELKSGGGYNGSFSTQHHFLGYEGRAAFPSNFDADYGYALGFCAFHLINNGLTGYIAALRNIAAERERWQPIGVPIVSLMNIEQRHGNRKPVIRKALVEMQSNSFRSFDEQREQWRITDNYSYPGAIQYFGMSYLCDPVAKTVRLDYS